MKKLLVLCGVIVLTGLGSCKKWLDAKPDENLYVDEVLVDRKGFARAMAGIYSQLGDASLYGRELEFGMVDVMAGYWQMSSNHEYYQDFRFNYAASGTQQRVAAIWSGLYKAIHQCNVILEQVDKVKSDPYYDLIKGETLGLRAFLHFELFKLFGPVVKRRGLDTKAIPYYTSSTKKAQQFLTSRACFNLIEEDLQAAKILLSEDPMITQGRAADGNKTADPYFSLIDRRGIHLNYYAVLALLARKSQWEGNTAEAIIRAQFLLDKLEESRVIRFVSIVEMFEIISGVYRPGDIRFTKENIFGLYINDMVNVKRDFIGGAGQLNKKLLPATYFQILYNDGNGLDLRPVIWGTGDPFIKLLFPYTEDPRTYDPNHYEASQIKLSEIYFILVEAYLEQDLRKALAYLNTVRQSRRLPALNFSLDLTKEKLMEYLVDEAGREFIGEGHLFTYYKHLYHLIHRTNDDVLASEAVFVFPIPIDEQQLNNGNGVY